MNAIIDSLQTLLDVHKKLVAIGDEKVELVKTGNISALETLLREEAKLMRTLEITEKIRMKQVEAYLAKHGIAKKDATLSDVKKAATAAERERLDALQSELVAVIDELKWKNERNQELIEESLRFVELSLDLIAPHKEDIAYNPHDDGDDDYVIGHSLFDRKA